MNYSDELNEEYRASLMRSCLRRLAEPDSGDTLPVMTVRVQTLVSLLNADGARRRAEQGEKAADDEVEALRIALDKAESEARRYASHYKPSSDGYNTFLMLADRIAFLATKRGAPQTEYDFKTEDAWGE